MGLRPMLYYYASGEQVTGCGDRRLRQRGDADRHARAVVAGARRCWRFALWRAVTRFDWRYGAVLVGYGAGILPWFANIDRQMYFFYMAPVAPFLVLATVLVMGEILGPAGDAAGAAPDRAAGRRAVGRASWWPTSSGCGRSSSGVPITPEMWDAQLWLPSWRPLSRSAAAASSALAVSASPALGELQPGEPLAAAPTRASSTTTTG